MMDVIEFWYWWVAATALVVLEILVPGTFFLWMGVSAAAVGVVVWVMPTMEWEWQFFLFAILSVASIALWRLRQRTHPTVSEDPNVNRRTKRYIGRTFTLAEPIVDGIGKIYVDDSRWRVSGPDCDVGEKVKVVSAESTTLIVEVLNN